MTIIEIPNSELNIQKIAMSCDKCITDSKGRSVAAPLMKTSHMYVISGASGSGKSNVLVSPSAHTIKDSPLENLSDDQKFNSLNEDVFDMVMSLTDNAVEEGTHTLLILDDVSSQLRTKENEKLLNQLVKNRRHLNASIWIVGHKVTDLSPALRSNANLIFLFKPKTLKEIDAIQSEYMLMSKQQADELMKAAYKDRYDFMLIDTSLRSGSDFLFYRNFNQLKFDEKDKTDSN